MNDFLGFENIILNPSSIKNTYGFIFTPATTITEKASLPYNLNIVSIVVSAYTEDNIAANDLIYSSSLSDNTITLALSYPAAGQGEYIIKFILTLNDNSVWVKTFNRISCEID